MNNLHKNSLYVLSCICGAALLLLATSLAYAQAVPVSFAPPDGVPGGPLSSAGGAKACFAVAPLGSTSYPYNGPVSDQSNNYVPTPSEDDPTPVTVNVSADGNNYGLRGSYTAVPPNCSSLSGEEQTLCQSVSSAFTAAVGAANGQAGFPHGNMGSPGAGYSGNTVSLQVGSGVCGQRDGEAVPLCENDVTFPNSSGGNSFFAFIYFDTASLKNPSGQTPGLSVTGEFMASAFENNIPFAQCDFAHELTHTFGVGDAYGTGQGTENTSYPGLMGDGCANIFNGIASTTFPNLWSANEAATVRWLNAVKPLVVNAYSCSYPCQAGQSISFIQATTGKGVYTPTCVGSTPVASDQIQCNCKVPTPYCTDLNTQQTVALPGEQFCTNQNLTYCTCPNGQPSCFDGNGSPVQEVPGAFSCDAPPGAVTMVVDGTYNCNCDNGSPSCVVDGTNNKVPPPQGFSCSDFCSTFGGTVNPADNPLCTSYCAANPTDPACPSVPTTQSLDFACDSDNACVQVAQGTGQYSDATCDDVCGY